MRIRALLFSTGVVAAAAALTFLSMQETTSSYTAREDQQIAASPDGAAEIWRRLRADNETGIVNESDYARLRKVAIKRQANMEKSAPSMQWAEMGPDNIGGRGRAIYIVNDNEIWTGGVSGGLWVSYNAANSWQQITSFPNCMVTSITRNGNGRWYVGTGSRFDGSNGGGASGFRGRGIYTSTDGVNWEIIADTDPGLLGDGAWTAVEALEADPFNAERIWFAGNAGFGYIDGTQVFSDVADGVPNNNAQDIEIAADGSYMLLVMDGGRVWRSTDNTYLDFVQLFAPNDPGFLPQSGIGRARVAISKDDVNHAYVLYSTGGGFFGGVYHSGNAGAEGSWSNIWPANVGNQTPLPRGQGIYDLALDVKKGDPLICYVGGIELWRSGPNYQAELAAFAIHFPGSTNAVHADVHEIRFGENGDMYLATDGGIYKSTDGGDTYMASNRNLNITQFYGIAYTPDGGAIGGTQDNGSLYIPANGSLTTDQEAIEIFGGDGFDCAASQNTEAPFGAAFVMSQYGNLGRFTTDGSGGPFFDDEIIALQNEEGEIGQFYSVCQLHEDFSDENSGQFVILVNPYEETVTDSTFNLNTLNLNMPFDYTLEPGQELRYWDQLIRPELNLEEPLTEDPNYFWLEAQQLTEEQIICTTDSIEVGTETIITNIEPIDSCITFLEEIICVTIGFDTTFAEVPVFEYSQMCDTSYFYAADTLYDIREQLLIQDPYTSLFAVGFIGSQGVWITREALNFNTTPDWHKVMDAPGSGGTKSIEFSTDGNYMWVSGWDASLTRVGNLRNFWDAEDLSVLEIDEVVPNAGGVVTGVSIDPNDPDHVVFTVGGYGNTGGGKVRESFNATSQSIIWDNRWLPNSDELSSMPVYDCLINVNNPDEIIIGTEFGVMTSNDGNNWEFVNVGMAPLADALACPVMSVEQQWRQDDNYSQPTNKGVVYAGSHGRGIFKSDNLVSVQNNFQDEVEKELFSVYPNPVTGGQLNVNVDLNAPQDVLINIFSMNGQLVKVVRKDDVVGMQRMTIDINELSRGQYFLQLNTATTTKVAKFVVLN